MNSAHAYFEFLFLLTDRSYINRLKAGVTHPSSPSKDQEELMPIDTFMAYSGTYPSVEDALADYDAVHELHTDVRLIDAYDAAVVERKADGKVKIVKKHETPTRVGGVAGAGVGLATGLAIALFPAAAIGGGLLRLLAAVVRCWVLWRAMPLPA